MVTLIGSFSHNCRCGTFLFLNAAAGKKYAPPPLFTYMHAFLTTHYLTPAKVKKKKNTYFSFICYMAKHTLRNISVWSINDFFLSVLEILVFLEF